LYDSEEKKKDIRSSTPFINDEIYHQKKEKKKSYYDINDISVSLENS